MAALAAILDIAACPFSKGTFLYSTPTHPAKMDLIGQGVLLEIDGNQKLTDGRTPAKFKMAALAAILDIGLCCISKGTFL